MRASVFTALVPVGLLALAGCEGELSSDVQDSPSIITEEESAAEQDMPIFRAIGQEPGWIVRIYPDITVYEAEYGERRVTVNTPEVEDIGGGRRYVTDALIVEIMDTACSDAMSGAEYPASVIITEEGRAPLQGCGGTP